MYEYHTYQQELQLVGLTMIDLSYILPDMKKENYTTYLNNEVVNVRYNGNGYDKIPYTSTRTTIKSVDNDNG